MLTTFEVQDYLYTKFAADTALMALLGNPATDEAKNIKFKREDFPVDVFNVADLDFISFYFSGAEGTNNFLVNGGIMDIDYYANLRYDAGLLVKEVMRILAADDRLDIQLYYERQTPSGTTGVYKYTQRFEVLIRGR